MSGISDLQVNEILEYEIKAKERIERFQQLIVEMRKHAIPADLVHMINEHIEDLNQSAGDSKTYLKLLRTTQTNILKRLEKDMKLVPKSYYRNMWIPLGMSAFGIPIGVAIGLSLHNMGLLGIGLPIGLGIGSIVGVSMDKKANMEGRQLDVEMK